MLYERTKLDLFTITLSHKHILTPLLVNGYNCLSIVSSQPKTTKTIIFKMDIWKKRRKLHIGCGILVNAVGIRRTWLSKLRRRCRKLYNSAQVSRSCTIFMLFCCNSLFYWRKFAEMYFKFLFEQRWSHFSLQTGDKFSPCSRNNL